MSVDSVSIVSVVRGPVSVAREPLPVTEHEKWVTDNGSRKPVHVFSKKISPAVPLTPASYRMPVPGALPS